MPSRPPFPRANPVAVGLVALLLAVHAVAPREPRPGSPREAAGRVEPPAHEAAAPRAASTATSVRAVEVAAGDVEPAAWTDEAPPPAAAGEPYPVQYLEVLVGGESVALAFVDVSPPLVNGRTAVLLRGDIGRRDDGGTAADAWAPTVAALSEAGFRVIVPDLVGSGRSGRPRATPSPDELAGHVAALLDSLGAPEAAVVGAGPDADVAARLAARWPGARSLVLAGVTDGPAGLALPTLVVTRGPGGATRPPGFDDALLAFLDR